MLIDTHCHLNLIQADSDQSMSDAAANGVESVIVPAVLASDFAQLVALNQSNHNIQYALGIHPMFVEASNEADLRSLDQALADYQPVAVGEIGLDYYARKDNQPKQLHFFTQQLQLAQQHKLPVILHVRGAIDAVLNALRQYPVVGGVAHAFNGSMQQAEQFIAMGFKLGFGGAMTFTRAKKIRHLAQTLPLTSIVLETDSPDMAPTWVAKPEQNTPKQLAKIAQSLAEMRGEPLAMIAAQTTKNAQQVFERLTISQK